MPASQPNLQPPPGRSVRLYGWREPAILTAAGLAWFSQVSADGAYVSDILFPSLLAALGRG